MNHNYWKKKLIGISNKTCIYTKKNRLLIYVYGCPK